MHVRKVNKGTETKPLMVLRKVHDARRMRVFRVVRETRQSAHTAREGTEVRHAAEALRQGGASERSTQGTSDERIEARRCSTQDASHEREEERGE